MQAAFLISAKDFTEKQVGVLFLVFGMSQFLCMAPAGYLLDYSNRKISWVIWAGILCSALTVITALSAEQNGTNMPLMILWKLFQGAISAILTPGFNSITLGIVGSTGFTHQVSRNRMMNHVGTALIVAMGSLIAYFLYPNIGALFIVGPLSAIGVYYNLRRIIPTHINRDAARNLITESPTMTDYEHMDDVAVCKQRAAILNWEESSESESDTGISKAEVKPLSVTAAVAPHRRYSAEPSLTTNMYTPPDLLTDGLQPPSVSLHDIDSPTPLSSPALAVEAAAPLTSETSGLTVTSNAVESTKDPRSTSNAGLEPSTMSIPNLDSTLSQKSKHSYSSKPSFVFGWGHSTNSTGSSQGSTTSQDELAKDELQLQRLRARTPLAVIMNPRLLTFTTIIFFFHLANSSVLPLVMQSLALRDAQAGILLSGLCILIAQGFMAFFAKLCGDYSPIWGRKNLMIVGLVALTFRCFILTALLSAEDSVQTEQGAHVLKALILSTQFLDSVGAGIIGTLQILVTNDISAGTGRFSLSLGVTTSAMCLGATVSGYIGQALAQDYGYPAAFTALGLISLIPFILYVFLMPETLPEYARPQPKKRRRRLRELLRRLNEHRRRILAGKNNPFRRKDEPPPGSFGPNPDSPLAKGHVELV